MISRPLFFAIFFALSVSAQSWYDLTVHNAVFAGTNMVSGEIRPAGALPTLADFNAAKTEISEAMAVASNSWDIALAASNAAARAAADIADATSNGVWEIAFTLSALRGVGAADDIESRTVGFSVEQTPTNRLCHVVQWFSSAPTQLPEFNCTYSTNLVAAGFDSIPVYSSWPETFGEPEDYGKAGGACYRVSAAVPLEWGQAYFKLTATGFVLRGNALPVVGGVAGGANYDITVVDAVGLTNVVLNIRGGFVVDTNNPIALMLYQSDL